MLRSLFVSIILLHFNHGLMFVCYCVSKLVLQNVYSAVNLRFWPLLLDEDALEALAG